MPRARTALTAVLTAVGLTAAAVALPVVPAAAGGAQGGAAPASPPAYPAGAALTLAGGAGFDTCQAPSLATLGAWSASPYRTVAVYIGGINRACADGPLSAGWVAQAAAMRWRLVPVYVGRQAPCVTRAGTVTIDPAQAPTQAVAAADDAVGDAVRLGLQPGSAIYLDMEAYTSSCTSTVLTYVSHWTRRLHERGYLAGVYSSASSGIAHLSRAYTSTTYTRPDAIWLARWDGVATTAEPNVGAGQWAEHQRIKQYRGDHPETWGGATVRVDADVVDAPVATVALRYASSAASSLNVRSGPGTQYPVVRSVPRGAAVPVLCQTNGATVGGTAVWDLLAGGGYATDAYVSTPGKPGTAGTVPACSLGYQVSATTSVRTRSGPGTGYSPAGTLAAGALARVTCQATGTRVGSTDVWDRLDDGRWVSDYYLATPAAGGRSPGLRAC